MQKRIQINNSTSAIFKINIEFQKGEWFLQITGQDNLIRVGAATVLILMESERNFKASTTRWHLSGEENKVPAT